MGGRRMVFQPPSNFDQPDARVSIIRGAHKLRKDIETSRLMGSLRCLASKISMITGTLSLPLGRLGIICPLDLNNH